MPRSASTARRKASTANQKASAAPPTPSETQIHISVVDHLRARGKPGIVWWHTPNEGNRDKRERSKLAAMGLQVGIPDLMLIHQGKTFGLELKKSAGRTSPEQKAMLAALERAGVFTGVAFGIDAALNMLEAWGLISPDVGRSKRAA
jgi:hypothetical protein